MRWWCNFVAEDRGQFFLMPPWIAEWLLEDHLAHFVLDVVEEMDLAGFYVGNRAGGWGGAARRGIPRRWSRCCSPTAPVISSSQIECACFTAGIRTRRIRASQSPARLRPPPAGIHGLRQSESLPPQAWIVASFDA